MTSSLLDHMDLFKDNAHNRFDATDAPAPLEGQRGVVIGLGTQPLLLEVFGTGTLFRPTRAPTPTPRQVIDAVVGGEAAVGVVD
ncbi:hypothetical protein AB4142_30570, partial [Variovorax sp. 2RAF20]